MENTEFTYDQLVSAFIVARTAGHEWAQAFADLSDLQKFASELHNCCTDAIVQHTQDMRMEKEYPGIESSIVKHTSPGGRIKWNIDSDGTFRYIVSRMAHKVLFQRSQTVLVPVIEVFYSPQASYENAEGKTIVYRDEFLSIDLYGFALRHAAKLVKLLLSVAEITECVWDIQVHNDEYDDFDRHHRIIDVETLKRLIRTREDGILASLSGTQWEHGMDPASIRMLARWVYGPDYVMPDAPPPMHLSPLSPSDRQPRPGRPRTI